MMLSDLVLHPRTRKQLERAIDRRVHAIGIVGSVGAGKATLANAVAAKLLDAQKPEQHRYFRRITPEKDSITIEQARDIISFTKLKTPGNQSTRRVVVIEQAETMTREAQNAMLKVIEEPPIDTVIILTVSSQQSVLATIVSRLQVLTVTPPTLDAVIEYFKNDFTTLDIQRAYTISNGNMGLLCAVIRDDTTHPLLKLIEESKSILAADTFERLTMVDTIVKDKRVDQLLYGLQQTAYAALQASAAKNNTAAIRRWHTVLGAVHESRELIAAHAQHKLVVTNLLVRI